MENLCYKCKKNPADESKTIEFNYQGIKFSVFKDGMTCFECQKNNSIERFKKHGNEIISVKEGKIKINWKEYLTGCDKDGNSYSRILIDISILSFDSEGNWEMDAGGICLNPISSGGSCAYFTREEDVREYAKIKGGNTAYSWTIRKFGKVVYKSEVLRF